MGKHFTKYCGPAANRIIHSHLPKTGGTWVNDVLEEILIIRGCNEIPSKSGHPTFGFVRNPWAWYVSWYNFVMHGSDIYKNIMSGPTFKYMPDREFETMLRHYITPTDRFKRNIAIEGLAWHQNSDWLTAWKHYTESWIGKDIAFYEHLYDLYLEPCNHIGKTESLQEDLKEILGKLGILTDELVTRIDNTKKINVGTKQVDYRTYYTDEMAQLVNDTHQRIITTHGYTFDK